MLGLDLSHSKHGRNREVEVAALWNVACDHKVKMFCGSRGHLSVALFVQHVIDNVWIHDSGSPVCAMWTVRAHRVNFPVTKKKNISRTHSALHLTKTNKFWLATFKKNMHKYSFKPIHGNLVVHILLYILYTSVWSILWFN